MAFSSAVWNCLNALRKAGKLPRFLAFAIMAQPPAPDLPDGYRKIKGLSMKADTYFVITGFKLKGSDTVKISFSANKACNVFGCYTTTGATDNYSLYISTTANAKYLRYDGGTYKSYFPPEALGVRVDAVITPTGSTGLPQNDTWTEADFDASADMCIGTTSPDATSSKLDGNIWGDVIVAGRFHGIPCERESDNALGYYDTISETFYEPAAGTPTEITS